MPRSSKDKRDLKVWIPLLVAFAAAIGLLAGYNMNFANNDLSLIKLDEKETGFINDGRIEEIIRFIENNYVDSLDQNEITIDVIDHILNSLDPHSSYITPEDLSDHNEKMEGKFKGIGIETISLRDTFLISRVVDDSPADKAGLKVGDAILSIEETNLAGNNSPIDNMRQYLNGSMEIDKLTAEVLSVDGNIKTITDLTPEFIELSSANEAYLINENTAYIKLARFSSNTYKQFMSSLESLVEQDQNINLLIDLRNNPGGYLPQAINILSQLFDEKDKMLTYTEGLNRKKSEYRTTGKVFYPIKKIAVLTNQNSASGSEIMAGAIQDWDRGLVIGQATYGKGLVQQIFPLSNGGALRLTVAKYYTPSGRLIQKSYDNISKDFIADTTVYKTKVLNRLVDGGGGVDPDYFIEDIFNDACREYQSYVDLYLLDKMKQKKTQAITNEDISQDELNAFITKEFGEGVEDLMESCTVDFNFRIQARLQRMLEGEIRYKELLNETDPYILKALELIADDKTTLALLSE